MTTGLSNPVSGTVSPSAMPETALTLAPLPVYQAAPSLDNGWFELQRSLSQFSGQLAENIVVDRNAEAAKEDANYRASVQAEEDEYAWAKHRAAEIEVEAANDPEAAFVKLTGVLNSVRNGGKASTFLLERMGSSKEQGLKDMEAAEAKRLEASRKAFVITEVGRRKDALKIDDIFQGWADKGPSAFMDDTSMAVVADARQKGLVDNDEEATVLFNEVRQEVKERFQRDLDEHWGRKTREAESAQAALMETGIVKTLTPESAGTSFDALVANYRRQGQPEAVALVAASKTIANAVPGISGPTPQDAYRSQINVINRLEQNPRFVGQVQELRDAAIAKFRSEANRSSKASIEALTLSVQDTVRTRLGQTMDGEAALAFAVGNVPEQYAESAALAAVGPGDDPTIVALRDELKTDILTKINNGRIKLDKLKADTDDNETAYQTIRSGGVADQAKAANALRTVAVLQDPSVSVDAVVAAVEYDKPVLNAVGMTPKLTGALRQLAVNPTPSNIDKLVAISDRVDVVGSKYSEIAQEDPDVAAALLLSSALASDPASARKVWQQVDGLDARLNAAVAASNKPESWFSGSRTEEFNTLLSNAGMFVTGTEPGKASVYDPRLTNMLAGTAQVMLDSGLAPDQATAFAKATEVMKKSGVKARTVGNVVTAIMDPYDVIPPVGTDMQTTIRMYLTDSPELVQTAITSAVDANREAWLDSVVSRGANPAWAEKEAAKLFPKVNVLKNGQLDPSWLDSLVDVEVSWDDPWVRVQNGGLPVALRLAGKDGRTETVELRNADGTPALFYNKNLAQVAKLKRLNRTANQAAIAPAKKPYEFSVDENVLKDFTQ